MSLNSDLFLDINGISNVNSSVDAVMIFCAQYLVFVIFVVALAIGAWLLYKREWKTALWLLGALVLSFIILKIANYIHPGVRPFVAEPGATQLIKHAPGISFPSDHTTVSAAIAFAVLFISRFKAIGWLLLLAAIVVGFARIFVGVHYPFDVLAGLGVGLVGAGVVAVAYQFFKPPSGAVAFDRHATFKK